MDVCYRKATKVGSTATVLVIVYWSYPILPFGIVTCTYFPTAFLEIAVTNYATDKRRHAGKKPLLAGYASVVLLSKLILRQKHYTWTGYEQR